VVSDRPVPRKITNQVGGRDPIITMDIKMFVAFAYICQQVCVVKDVNSGLIIKQDPTTQDATTFQFCMHGHADSVLLHEFVFLVSGHSLA
jgi:hypothetical protein